jgi:hypothetical protein
MIVSHKTCECQTPLYGGGLAIEGTRPVFKRREHYRGETRRGKGEKRNSRFTQSYSL